jgi:glycosyltransferase involved in cell wall biosynthesis
LNKAIVSVINDLVTDQRVNKTCNVLRELGFDVLLVGRVKRDSLPLPKRNYRMHRMKLLFEKGPLFYAEFNIRLFIFLLFHRACLFFSNDLDTLLPNYLISKLKSFPLVYDSHEYFTETPELVNRKFVQNIWKNIEQWIFPKLNDVITVSQSIADLFHEKYRNKVAVVRNIPPLPSTIISDNPEHEIPGDLPVVLLQGSGINVQRGAEELVQAMQYVKNARLLIVGGGDVINTLKQMAGELNLGSKIVFIQKVPLEELRYYTSRASLGVSLEKDTNINYRFMLPNKLFEYIHAGVPVLVSPMVEMKKIVDKYQVGETISSHDPEDIARHISKMINDQKRLNFYRENCKNAAAELNWENEKQVLIKILKKYA